MSCLRGVSKLWGRRAHGLLRIRGREPRGGLVAEEDARAPGGARHGEPPPLAAGDAPKALGRVAHQRLPRDRL